MGNHQIFIFRMKTILVFVLLLAFAVAQVERRAFAWKPAANKVIDTIADCARNDPKAKKYASIINSTAGMLKGMVSSLPGRREWGFKSFVSGAKNAACKLGAKAAKATACPMLVSKATALVASKVSNASVKTALTGCISRVGTSSCQSGIDALCKRERRMFAWKPAAHKVVAKIAACARQNPATKKYGSWINKAQGFLDGAINAMPFRRREWGWGAITSWVKKAANGVRKGACALGAKAAKATGCPMLVNKATQIVASKISNKNVKIALNTCIKKLATSTCRAAIDAICKRERRLEEIKRRMFAWKPAAHKVVAKIAACARANPATKKYGSWINKAQGFLDGAINAMPFRRREWGWGAITSWVKKAANGVRKGACALGAKA